MPRRLLLLVALAALFCPGVARAETVTIQVKSVVIKVTPVDRAPKGRSTGDRVIQRNKLTNAVRQFGKPKGARVGTDSGTVTFTSANTARFDGVARLPGGTIKIRGNLRPLANGGIQIPIAGGTGRYARATGTVTVEAGDDPVLNVYRVTLPGTVA
jgi:dirigent-like protein